MLRLKLILRSISKNFSLLFELLGEQRGGVD